MSEEVEIDLGLDEDLDLGLEEKDEEVVEKTPQYEFLDDFEILQLDHIDVVYNDPVCIIDTDSVTADTVISINGESLTIEDYYNSCSENEKEVAPNDYRIDFEHEFDHTTTLDPITKKIISKPVTRIYKHLVKKPMFRIEGIEDGMRLSKVTCTGDHSIMVLRNGKIIEVTPLEVKLGDLMVIDDN